jgi:hypothetical protein
MWFACRISTVKQVSGTWHVFTKAYNQTLCTLCERGTQGGRRMVAFGINNPITENSCLNLTSFRAQWRTLSYGYGTHKYGCLGLVRESRESSVGIALGFGLDDRDSGVRFPAGTGNFYLHHRVQNGSGPPNLLSNWYQGLFPWGHSGRGVKLNTHLHPVRRSRMRGAIPPLPNTFHGVVLS